MIFVNQPPVPFIVEKPDFEPMIGRLPRTEHRGRIEPHRAKKGVVGDRERVAVSPFLRRVLNGGDLFGPVGKALVLFPLHAEAPVDHANRAVRPVVVGRKGRGDSAGVAAGERAGLKERTDIANRIAKVKLVGRAVGILRPKRLTIG